MFLTEAEAFIDYQQEANGILPDFWKYNLADPELLEVYLDTHNSALIEHLQGEIAREAQDG